MAAKGRVLEEPRDEAVALDLADLLLLQRPHPHPGLPGAGGEALVMLVVVAVVDVAAGVGDRRGRRSARIHVVLSPMKNRHTMTLCTSNAQIPRTHNQL